MTRLLRVAAVVVLVGGSAAVLSSCTGSTPEVDPSPTVVVTSSSPEPSVTASPTPTALPPLTEEEVLALIPADAQVGDFFGASAFARFFYAEYIRMFQTLDTRLWSAMSAAECDFCQEAVASVVEISDSGGSRTGGGISLDPADGLGTGGLREDGYFYVGFRFTLDAWEDRDGTGNVIGSGAAATGETAVKLSYEDGQWRVIDVGTAVD